MGSVAARMGDGPYGLPLMKFTLTYDGKLPSAGNGSNKVLPKWKIRQHFHPQFEELWEINPVLKEWESGRMFPVAGGTLTQTHHTYEGPVLNYPLILRKGQQAVGRVGNADGEIIDLWAPIVVGGRTFLPIVRNSLALTCSLDILFMRREAPGKVYQGGDLDNRVKTLLDALSVPKDANHIVKGEESGSPIYCLLEDDSLLTGLSVKTERLLGGERSDQSEVRLIINVDVRVSNARIYNQSFLGD